MTEQAIEADESMQPLFTLAELDGAVGLLREYFPETPAIHWPLLSESLGADVVVKHENCTPTGAFKVRGGLVFMDRLRRRQADLRGVMSASVGNHGLSLGYAGQIMGVPVTIVVPEGTEPDRIAALQATQANVIVHGHDFEAARLHSVALSERDGLELVPPFHPDLVLGVATYARELFDRSGPLDAVIVPVGMGSGIVGLITTRDLLGLDTQIIGAGADGAPTQRLSFEAGRVVPTETADTFAAGVATRQPDPLAAAIVRSGAVDVLTVSDDDIAEAIRLLWRTTHHLAEPAGAVATAVLNEHRDRWAGQRVGVILSGSIMNTALAATILSGGTHQSA